MDQEDERVLYNIQNGTRMVSMLLFADARMALWLYQMLSRMYDQKLLKHTDLLTFEKFIKVTKGKLDLINVPGAGFKTGANPLLCDAGSNQSDGMVQIAVFSEDRQKFQALFEQHINREMQGGRKGIEELSRPTENHVSYISIQCIRENYTNIRQKKRS